MTPFEIQLKGLECIDNTPISTMVSILPWFSHVVYIGRGSRKSFITCVYNTRIRYLTLFVMKKKRRLKFKVKVKGQKNKKTIHYLNDYRKSYDSQSMSQRLWLFFSNIELFGTFMLKHKNRIGLN